MLCWHLPQAGFIRASAVLVYAAGLLGGLSASAAYNLCPPGSLKARLQLLDHAAIFTVIARSYTPYAVLALPPHLDLPLLVVIWSIAVAGVALMIWRFA